MSPSPLLVCVFIGSRRTSPGPDAEIINQSDTNSTGRPDLELSAGRSSFIYAAGFGSVLAVADEPDTDEQRGWQAARGS